MSFGTIFLGLSNRAHGGHHLLAGSFDEDRKKERFRFQIYSQDNR